MNYKIIATTVSALLLASAVLYLAWILGTTTNERSMNLMVTIGGTVLGWLIGILATPYDVAEKDQFTIYAKTISAFLSGYAVAKVDRLVDAILDPALALHDLAPFRILAFLSAAGISFILVFVFRRYAR